MGGDSNPRCLSAHTLSRRAQSTALSPIQTPHTLTANLLYGKLTAPTPVTKSVILSEAKNL